LNETFCRALLQAGLTEDDIAARLAVDPKTVRRWIEGRALPYRRHRWALAALLGTPETDLWPQLRSAAPRPEEVEAIYPHLAAVPSEVWLSLFESAQHEVSILDHSGRPFARAVPTALVERARTGIRMRICLADSDAEPAGGSDARISPAQPCSALGLYAPLRDVHGVELRRHHGVVYTLVFRADDQLLIAQHVYGVSAGQTPTIRLRRADGGGMFAAYLQSFERTWSSSTACAGDGPSG
jgi:transcriptional regulator with XRE-family HTH domain